MRVCGLRLTPAMIPAFMLSACADPYVFQNSTTVSSGSWKIERQLDRVTGGPIDSAYVSTRSSSHTGQLFAQPAKMQLACFLNKPAINFTFNFKVGTNLNSFLGYRFDEKPGHEIGARFVQASSTVVIEEPAEVSQFVGELATSKVLYVRIRSDNGGRTVAEFNVDGAPAAVQAAFAHCPVTPSTPARTASLRTQPGAR